MPVAGETRTLTGRRRTNVEKLTDHLNAPVQGSAADGLKLALALLWERRGDFPAAVPVLVCHGEVVVECEAEEAADANKWRARVLVKGFGRIVRAMNVP
jgi:DNA polymerase I